MTKIASTLRRMFRVEYGKTWLLGIALTLLVLLLTQGARYCWIGRSERTLTAMLERGVQGPPKREPEKSEDDYKAILEKTMLGTPKKPPPKFSLWGIIGEEALLGAAADSANPFKVGAKLPSGEEVVRIGVNDVVLSKDGKERTLYVHDALKPGKDSKPPAPAPSSPAPPKTGEAGSAVASSGESTEAPPPDAPEVESKSKQTVPEAAEVDKVKLQAATEAAKRAIMKELEAARLKTMEENRR